MHFLDNITDNTLLIIPNHLKEKVLRKLNNNNKLINIKILSFEELKKHFYFDYQDDALLYLMDKYHYKYEVSKILIENMYYVDNKEYKSDKLNHLVNLKQELLNQNLLKENPLFSLFISNKNIIIYGYDYIDSFYQKILNNFKKVKVIPLDKIPDCELVSYQASDIYEEVNFVFSKIAKLIDSGIDINKIKITNVDDSYSHILKVISNFYNIPLSLPSKTSFLATTLGKRFITYLNNGTNLSSVIEKYQEENEIDPRLMQRIISTCNRFIDLDYPYPTIKASLLATLKKVNIPLSHLAKEIEVVPFYDNTFDNDEYIFLMNFNQGSSPLIYKDEDYISDNLKLELQLDNVNIKNSKVKEAFINKLYSINNLTISYKLKSISEEYYPSNLIKELNILDQKIELDTSYSLKYSTISLGMMLDELIKYDIVNDKLDLYYNNINIPYRQYDNKFTGIDPLSLKNKLNNNLILSYTSIDNYYRCAFRYYISNILKLDKYEETFNTLVGNLFHYLLSICLKDNFSFDKEWDNYLQDKKLLVNEQFFLIKLKEELKLIITEVKRLHQETGLTDSLLEQKITIDKSNSDINVTFIGIVDKIMYKNIDGKDLITIIDYKTGNPSINLFNTIYGIDMQLPIYLYLVKYSTLFSNPSFVGFYLQKILHGEINKSKGKTYLEQKKDNLKLTGYSTSNENILERFDPTYENSEFIKSMKLTSKGFYSYAKVIEDEKIDLLINLVSDKINDAIKEISKAKFTINPKRIGQELTGCLYCKYKDLCYMKEEDIVNLKEYHDLSFLFIRE